MRAAILDGNGSFERVQVGHLDPPVHAPDTILIRVRAASINPADLKVVSGKDGGSFLHSKRFPTAFGFDFSGVVERIGEKITGRAIGDEVFGHLPYSRLTRQGSFAELVAVRPDSVATKPAGVSHEDAAATATAGSTALQGLRDRGRLRAGQRVLVNGASGGVGSFAVQIAALLGAEVVGTASEAKRDFVRSLGVDRVLDYRETPITELDEKFDLVFDAASTSSFGEARRVLDRGGSYVTLLPSLGLLAGMLSSLFSTKRCGFVTVQSRAADLAQLGKWLGTGELRASVESRFPLSEIGTALSALASGTVRGKVAMSIDE